MPAGTGLRLPTPQGVLLGNPWATDEGGLLASTLNVLTSYGTFQSRPGITKLGPALDPAEPVMGSMWVRDKAGVIQLVVATTRRWWAFNNTTREWIDLSAGHQPVTGETVDTMDPVVADQEITGTLKHPVLPGSVTFTDHGSTPQVVTDNGAGVLVGNVGSGGTMLIDYATGIYSFSFALGGATHDGPVDVAYQYTGFLLTGTPLMPTTFTYWEEGGKQYLIGVNNQDPAVEWEVGALAYQSVTNSYVADTICTVANRLVYGCPDIGGVDFPTMVAWTAAGQRTNNPTLARDSLIDTSDKIVAVRRMGRLAGVVYREWSQWMGNAIAASDARAFQFTVADRQPGPIGPAAVAEGPGLRHLYFGSDLNLYTFDGVNSTLLAATANLLTGRFSSGARQTVSVVFYPIGQYALVSLPLDGEQVPTHLLAYSFQTRGVFLGRWNPAIPITTIGTWQLELETPTHLLPNVPTHQLPDVVTHRLGFIAGQLVPIVGAAGQVYTLDGTTDDGVPIPLEADVLLPIIPGQDYEFDGVEMHVAPPANPITVSALLGPTLETLTEYPLGVIDPTLPPGDTEPGQPNAVILRAPGPMRGAVCVLRFTCAATQVIQIRRVAFFAWPRKVQA